MSSLEQISVNLLATAGTGFDVKYLIQGRNAIKLNLPKGKYPFYWPGALSVFGGQIEKGESPEQGALREISEELHLNFTPEQMSNIELRTYNWKEDAIKLYEEINEFFHGNLAGFFGPSFSDKLPSCVLGKEREKFEAARDSWDIEGTYFDWLRERTDHYLVADFETPLDLKDYEGIGAIWLPHWAARAIVTTACDKLAILDDIVKKAKAGKLQIEPNK